MSVVSSNGILDSINIAHACLVDNVTQDPRTSCFTNDSVALSYGIFYLMSIVCFLLSVLTNNDSWVDRFWSIIPVVCAWLHTFFPVGGKFVMPTEITTQLIFTGLVTLWGARLTYNFYRKGGYRKGGEDYRWNYVRTWPIVSHPAVWPFFSLLVISVFQVFLLVAIALPVSQLPPRPPTGTDWLFISAQSLFLLFEAAADQQQWDFHQYKLKKQKNTPLVLQGDCERGFLTHGLFSFSRHPNVVCEQIFWVTLFFASTVYAGFSVSFIGAAILIVLTNYSSALTEQISSEKYPAFKLYQKSTPFLYPSPMSTRWEIDRNMAGNDLVVRGKKLL